MRAHSPAGFQPKPRMHRMTSFGGGFRSRARWLRSCPNLITSAGGACPCVAPRIFKHLFEQFDFSPMDASRMATCGAERLSIMSQNLRELGMQRIEIRVAKRSAAPTLDCSALQPNVRILRKGRSSFETLIHSLRRHDRCTGKVRRRRSVILAAYGQVATTQVGST